MSNLDNKEPDNLQEVSKQIPSTDSTTLDNRKDVNFTPEKTDPSTYKFYPDDPESTINRYKFYSKDPSQFFDPCEESAKMSFKCLELNDYDRQLCRDYFDAYRECKKQWLRARRNDRGQWE